jgi:hypothetical protein
MNINYIAKTTIFLIILNISETIISMEITNSSKILLGAKKTFEVQQGCHEIVIPNNFKKLVLNLNSENLDAILLTDSKIENCDEKYDITKCCTKNSTFCIENINPTKNDLNLNYCIRNTNLYACKLNKDQGSIRILQGDAPTPTNESAIPINTDTKTQGNNTDSNASNTDTNTPQPSENNPSLPLISSGPGSITIEALVIKDQGCQTAEFIPEVACSTLGLQNCKNPQFCSDRCVYVECRTELENPNARVFSMCLPFNLTDSDISNRCRNHITFNTNEPFVYKKQCEKIPNDQNQDKYLGVSSHKFFKFLIFLMGAIVIILFVASVYYRFSKKYNDGIPPFEAPWFMPNFIFPK